MTLLRFSRISYKLLSFIALLTSVTPAVQHCGVSVGVINLMVAVIPLIFIAGLVFVVCGAILNESAYVLINLGSLALISPFLFRGMQSSEMVHQVADLTIAQANVFHHNPNFEEAIITLIKADAELITIQELNSDWAPTILKNLKPIYPYFHEEYQDSCCYGIGVYSKYPILSSRSMEIEGVLAIEARLQTQWGELTVYSQHTLPPVFPDKTAERNRQLEELSKLIQSSTSSVIALGDFNVVPWDPVMKCFLKTSGQTRINSGFQATYPMDFGVPIIPIDYITYSSSLLPTACKTFVIPGSDHKGIVASFKFKE